MKKQIYAPRKGSVAADMLRILRNKPIGKLTSSSELTKELGIKLSSCKPFLLAAIKAGFVQHSQLQKKNADLNWQVTQEYRDHMSGQTPKPRTQMQLVALHKEPYELEVMVRGAFEARDDRQKFAAAMEELYRAAGIPLMHVRLAA